ncbi:MAG: hypothetical protein HQL06_15930 [Nitrospirae bacterium]|nr:hypothetical protein [Nitrospirota bacterium]
MTEVITREYTVETRDVGKEIADILHHIRLAHDGIDVRTQININVNLSVSSNHTD